MSITDVPLYLSLEFHKLLFHTTGQFYLNIRLQGSIEKQNDVKLFINDSKTAHSDPYYISKPYDQDSVSVPIDVSDLKLVFHLPPGYIEHDVYLMLEAYKVSQDASTDDEKYGESSLLVYPNNDSLFSTTVRESSKDNNEILNIEKQLLFISESELNGVSMSMGSLWFSGVMKTENEPKKKVKEPVKKPKVKKKPALDDPPAVPEKPGPSTTSYPGEDSVPSTPTAGLISEIPLGTTSSPAHPRHLCGSYLPREGYCEVAVLVHAAVGLPVKADGQTPQTYVIGKSRRDSDRGLQSQSVTHTSVHATHNPTWGEVILVEFTKDSLEHEELIINVADHPSKELLVQYEIPLTHLKTFYQYHLELVKPNKDLNNNSRLYISLIVKPDRLPLPRDDEHIFGLEMLVRGTESPITNQLGSLVAVARLVLDWHDYKETVLASQPGVAGVPMTTISLPSPHPTSFLVAGESLGSPQVSVGGDPVSQPQWNQLYYIPGDIDTLFTGSTAVVIEFYRNSHALNDGSWSLYDPVGYCSQRLTKELLAALQQDNARLGLRINGLTVHGSITTPTGTKASIGIVLRLLKHERPEVLVPVSQFSSLPLYGQTQPPGNVFTAQPISHNDKNPFGLPPFDAVQRLLPSHRQEPAFGSADPFIPPLTQAQPTHVPDGSFVPSDLRNTMDMRTVALLDYQMKEVDRYRTAMRKLAADLLYLRQENTRLEEANSRYRRDLSQHEEISRMMVSANDLDNVTHTELIQKFVLLKKKLSDESTKRQELQKRTQKLQNDLIKKNEKEKDLVKLEGAHESQQALLQKMQTKLQKYKSLQETCQKQEQVIVELETILSKGENGTSFSDPTGSSRVYIEENVRLRLELERYKGMVKEREANKLASPRVVSPKQTSNDPMDDSERLELYQKLEKAEGRILGLEKQLTENARKWAKEKTTLQTRLNEILLERDSRYNITNDASMMPDVRGSPKYYNDYRHSSPKLDPLTRR